MKQKIVRCREKISEWYSIHKRDLPWRETSDAYKIWVSEIILQQTQVKTGLEYYKRFIAKFPVIEQLAKAEEDEVLRLWQGLGYYSRARNMHFAAKQVVEHFNGVFPNKYREILSLKGVGIYTASAISSIAFNLPFAVVDGNVIRVISRLFGIIDPVDASLAQKKISEVANLLLDRDKPGDYNQAMMEFGALYCTPKNPDCDQCTLSKYCTAYLDGKVDEIPVKKKKLKVRSRYFYYLQITIGDALILQKRTSGDIWEGLFEYPLVESKKDISQADLLLEVAKMIKCDAGNIKSLKKLWGPKKHVLSHQVIHASFYALDFDPIEPGHKHWVKVNESEKTKYPVARITDLFWEVSAKEKR